MSVGWVSELLDELKSAYWNFSYMVSPDHRTVTISGVSAKFIMETKTEFGWLSHGTLIGEKAIIEDLVSNIRRGDIFFDIGANIGLHSCFVSKILDAGDIIAFEPHPKNAARCKENFGLNKVANGRVIQIALSNTDGKGRLILDKTEAGAGENTLLTDDELESGVQSVPIDVARGDQIIADLQLPKPTVVKIDVEGAEQKVTLGLEKALAADICRLLYCEVHEEKIRTFGGSPKELYETLNRFGFELETIQQRKSDHTIRGRKS